MRRLLNRKGQSTLEYAVLIALVVVALTGIHIYMKRGVEGKMRTSSDNIGDQFDPHNTSYSYTTETTAKTKEWNASGETDTRMGPGESEPEIVKEYGTETVGAW